MDKNSTSLPNLTYARLKKIIADKNLSLLWKYALKSNVVDFSELVIQLSVPDIVFLLRSLRPTFCATIFIEFPDDLQEALIEILSDRELRLILDSISIDDMVDMLEKFDDLEKNRLLKLCSKEKREEITKILKYSPDTAARIMTVGTLTLRDSWTVSQAVSVIKKKYKQNQLLSDDNVSIEYFVVNKNDELIGKITLLKLVSTSSQVKVISVMEETPISVYVSNDQEEVIETFYKYNLKVLPVINNLRRFVGVIYADDVLEAVKNENAEDMGNIAGILSTNTEDYFNLPFFKRFWLRIVWLGLTVLLQTITQVIIVLFIYSFGFNKLHSGNLYWIITAVIPLIPVILLTGEIAANQSAVVSINHFLEKNLRIKTIWKLISSEINLALIVSVVLTILNFVRLVIFYQIQFGHISTKVWWIILISSISIFSTVIVAKSIGFLVPIGLHKLKKDYSKAFSPALNVVINCIATTILLGVTLGLITIVV